MRRAFFRRFLAPFGIALTFGGLAQATPPQERIIDGTLVPATDYPAVTKVLVPDSLCTGTLITSRFVLSAAHCFYDDRNRPLSDLSGISAVINNVTYSVKALTIHPSYVPRSSACVQKEFDAAILELNEEATGVTPIELSREAPSVGTQLLLVGFGTQGSGSNGEDGTVPPDGFVNFGTTTIETIPDDQYVEWTFNQGEANTAGGDSGGPAFVDVNGTKVLNSITCGGTGNAEIGTTSTNTRVDTIASWIDSITGNSPAGQGPAFVGLGSLTTGANQAFSYKVTTTGSAPITITATGLPDGLTLSGSTISGTPTTAGTYNVALSASNDVGSATGTLVINVTAFDPSTALTLKRVSVNFDDETKDLLSLQGSLAIGGSLTAKGTQVDIQIGDLQSQTFILNKRGQASRKRGFDSVRFTGKLVKGVFTGTSVRFAIGLSDSNQLFKKLDSLFPFDTDGLPSTYRVNLPVEIRVNGVAYRLTVPMKYVARRDTWVNG